MELLRSVSQGVAWSRSVHRSGRTIALVPTMGYLHEGHLSLVREAKCLADEVAVTIFVNPTQFGPKEDLARYPRDLEGDVSKCQLAGASMVLAPPAEEVYPKGFQTFVEVTELSKGLCGARRPGHFRGVATVVTKLFGMLRPEVALFGEKDYQQLQVIRALARDLDLGVEVRGLPTVREADGLAMSSRNAYLSAEQRGRATAIWRGLSQARKLAGEGQRAASVLLAAVRTELEKAGIQEDYVELVDADSLVPLPELTPNAPARLLVAGFLGTTRLIDNVAI